MLFEQAQFQLLLGHHFLQGLGLMAQCLHLARGGFTRRVPRQAPLAGFMERLGPGMIHALGNTVLTASPSSTMRILSSAE